MTIVAQKVRQKSAKLFDAYGPSATLALLIAQLVAVMVV